MVYSNRPLFHNPTDVLPGVKNRIDATHITIGLPSGEVLSVQPNGAYESRPVGTAGPYEVAEDTGSAAIYTSGGNVFAVAIMGA